MRFLRQHRKVFLWWGRWWAVQLYMNRYFSLGIHVDFNRPYADIYIGWLTFSLGDNPVITDATDRKKGRCRGFIFSDDPVM